MAKRKAIQGILLAAPLLAACAIEAPEPPADAPRLVLLLSVDQLGAGHLTRFDAHLKGGLRRLLDEGVTFTEAHHAHAGTTTAPGHATLATGCHPSSHGIISNYWFDRATGERVYSVDDPRHGKAPSRLECSTLGDWLKASYPASRVYSLSGKDRSAILMGGRRADGVYWYDWDGGFTSSSYYREREPAWLETLNGEGFLAGKFGEVWEPLPFEPEELAALGVFEHDLGPLEERFPHPIGGPSVAPGEFFFDDLYESPWLDDYMLQAARALVSARRLGQDRYPDLLALGFSTTDAVGHGHGPWSREFLDILLRLDAQLGDFFDWLDATVGWNHVAVALSSDHGSVPLPEMRARQGLPGSRLGVREIACFQSVEAALDEEFGERDYLEIGPFFAPLPPGSEELASRVRQRTRSLIEACPSVSRVWLAEELVDESDDDEMQRKFARSHVPGVSPDLTVAWDEYFLKTASVASSHGTPHRYDTHVPIVLRRAGAGPGSVDSPVRTVDIAPTLAAWVGVEVPERSDGSTLDALVVEQPAAANGGA